MWMRVDTMPSVFVFSSYLSICMRVPSHLVVGDGEERHGSPPDTASSCGPLH